MSRLPFLLFCLVMLVFMACENNEQSQICPTIFRPVCGCNGITYDNSCLAENAGTTECAQGTCPLTDSALVLFTGSSDTLCRYAIEIRKIKYGVKNLPTEFKKDSTRLYINYTRDVAFRDCFSDSADVIKIRKIIN